MSEDRVRAACLVAEIVLEELIAKQADAEARRHLCDALALVTQAYDRMGRHPIPPEAMAWAEAEAKRFALYE